MTRPVAHLAMAAAAHEHLLERLTALTDESATGPSLLPGWTRAELVTHLARNADSHRHMCEGALRGEVAVQYPGGLAARAAEIEQGRGRAAAEVVADLAQSVEWLHETWESMTDEAWAGSLGFTSGPVPALSGPWRRTFEVEVHHADLALDYGPGDWPVSFVEEAIQMVVLGLPQRASEPFDDEADGVWVLWADDLELAWVVDASPDGVEILPLGDDQPDGMARGPAASILWWLLGRERADSIKDLSQVGRVPDLPTLFPYR